MAGGGRKRREKRGHHNSHVPYAHWAPQTDAKASPVLCQFQIVIDSTKNPGKYSLVVSLGFPIYN